MKLDEFHSSVMASIHTVLLMLHDRGLFGILGRVSMVCDSDIRVFRPMHGGLDSAVSTGGLELRSGDVMGRRRGLVVGAGAGCLLWFCR